MKQSEQQFAAAKRANHDFFFPESAAWSDGVQRRFKVTDPNRATAESPLQLNTDPIRASLRLVKFHPDDHPLPEPGASVQSSKGLVVLGAYTDAGNLFGTRTAVGRLVDERAYPLYALSDQGWFRLRVLALDAAAMTATSNDLVTAANNSHRGFTPPGIRLDVGEVITTSEGDQYQVVPPVQRDLLGDVVGLSWQRGGVQVPPPGTAPTPTDGGQTDTPATPADGTAPDDRWWREGL